MNEQLIIGLQGPELSAAERVWLRERPPLGVILFARNIECPEQVRDLLADVRSCSGQQSWAAIDEEGGRVNRIPWPPFDRRRPAAEYGEMFATDPQAAVAAVYGDSLEAGEALQALGFTHNCAPVLDLFHADGHDIIGNRAYAGAVEAVSELGTACMRGLRDAGIEAVGKHFPGHGRANADSHLAVPEVDAPLAVIMEEADTFARLAGRGLRHIMTAHVVYTDTGSRVATLSSFWLQQVLRQRLHFSGRIWSDDLCMKGVGDNLPQAAVAALAAGCDTLLVCLPEGVRAIYEDLYGGG